MSGLMTKKTTFYSIGGLLVVAVLLVVVNFLFGVTLKSWKWDLTENHLYTLSDGTRNILKGLDEPVTLRLYFSEKILSGIPSIMNYGRRVRELLEEYESLSDGKIRLIVSDPEPFSEEEDQAVQYGLQGVPVDSAGGTAYFGLVGTNSTDDKEVIAFFQPEKEQSLEYDLSKLVHKLNNPKQRVVGLLSGLPMEEAAASPFMSGRGSQEWFILSQLKQSFTVRDVAGDAESIPGDIDVLLLVHPKQLSDKTLYAIDQFVLGGGRLMAFVDPFAEADVPASDPQNPMAAMSASRSSSLDKLFDAWGVRYSSLNVVGDRPHAMNVTVNERGRPRTVDYVAWLRFGPESFNKNDFVTADLKGVNVGTSGYVEKKEGADIEFTPLIETSSQAMRIDRNRFQFSPDPAGLLRSYQSGGKRLAIAARIRGKVKSAFPEGLTSAGKDAASALKESKDDINVIVVADTDMLTDRFWVNVQNFFGRRVAYPHASNDAFLINAIDNLSGSNDLISLRSRGKSARPFTKVLALKQAAEQRFRDKEQALQTRLNEAERKINELQQQKQGDNAMILSAEQRAEIDKFRAQQVTTRKELRAVKHELGKDIESLGSWLKFLNIALLPILLVLLAATMGIYRTRHAR